MNAPLQKINEINLRRQMQDIETRVMFSSLQSKKNQRIQDLHLKLLALNQEKLDTALFSMENLLKGLSSKDPILGKSSQRKSSSLLNTQILTKRPIQNLRA
jgi:hypothetical protein